MFITKKAKLFLGIGLGIVVASGAILLMLGLPLGIDFTGGALTEISYEERPEKGFLEEKLGTELELGGFSLRETTEEDGRAGFILRTKDLTEEERLLVEGIVLSEGAGGEISRFTSIGPVIGEELREKAKWAIVLVILVIVSYVAFGFRGVSEPVSSWVYGMIVILVLIHDILVPTAVMGILGYAIGAEVDVLFVMAILAVLGYSVNDTIVVFDRVRENLSLNQEKNKHHPFEHVVGMSLEQTFTRSINTSLTTLLALLALFFFGGDITHNFALVLIVGVIAGTYSSLFIASPLLVAINNRQIKNRKKK